MNDFLMHTDRTDSVDRLPGARWGGARWGGARWGGARWG